ncbi:MAG TPA: GWxTD domain-containing protein [Acidobacteriota bacterium]|nr:GWxTD domain-containing protein [Acidobacteriota bacterium]
MSRLLSITLALILLIVPAFAQRDKKEEALRREEGEDYYKKWLNEDVKYIISPDEKAVFQKLTSDEEKEQFIEQFWYRRDPDPMTPTNEFKEEHYRRIAYANERFASGIPGWMTDRGRIYIIHGPPAEIESHPSGGTYNRPMHEGGGTTSTFPFEIWRYRHIEGIGSDIELEFVDSSMSGEYRLALNPEEKDALLYVPGAGLTLAEEMGLATKADRPFFNPGMRENYPMMHLRAKDNPFERYETYTMVQRPRPIKYKDLKEVVSINIDYKPLPFEVRQDYIRLNDQQVLVPISLEVQNKDLSFKEENGVHNAKLAVYGIITSITNRIIMEFDDDVLASYQPEDLARGLTGRSIYQKIVTLDKKMRYKLDLVVKDINSGHTGVKRIAIVPPIYDNKNLSASSLILSDYIHQLPQVPKVDEMFVLGDVKIRPSLRKTFTNDRPLGVYLQLYNVGLDQANLAPALAVSYKIIRDGETVVEVTEESGESVQYFSGQRVVLIKSLPIKDLQPGRYTVAVEVKDLINNQDLNLQDNFQVTPPPQLAAK